MSGLARAGNMLRVRRSDTEGDVGVGWETSTSLHATGPGSGDYNNMLQEDPTLFDRTWHGTKVSKEQMQTGAYEYSEVPRHGALRLPGSKPFGADGLQLVLRAGMLDALQVLPQRLRNRPCQCPAPRYHAMALVLAFPCVPTAVCLLPRALLLLDAPRSAPRCVLKPKTRNPVADVRGACASSRACALCLRVRCARRSS